jgi:hypothetical protein
MVSWHPFNPDSAVEQLRLQGSDQNPLKDRKMTRHQEKRSCPRLRRRLWRESGHPGHGLPGFPLEACGNDEKGRGQLRNPGSMSSSHQLPAPPPIRQRAAELLPGPDRESWRAAVGTANQVAYLVMGCSASSWASTDLAGTPIASLMTSDFVRPRFMPTRSR